MISESVVLLLLGVLLAEPVSRALAEARWTHRDPIGALLLWQAVGLAGGLALLGAGLTCGLAPLGDSLPTAVLTSVDGNWGRLGAWQLIALAATAALAARLLGVLGLATVRTTIARRRHRNLLDLLATPWPAMPGARVLAHPLPVAYCLPGVRSRLVLSQGILTALARPELAAVLAHERTHLRERHDLVVLPFVAWGATAPWVPGMVRAQAAVAALVEMRADDVASAQVGRLAVADALRRVGNSGTPNDDRTVASFSAATAGRLTRLEQHLNPPPWYVLAAPRMLALSLVAVPTLALLHP